MGSVQIKGTQILDSAIVAAKLASNAVTAAKLADGSITSAKIGASAVLTAAINDAAVTAAKIGASAVETAKINDAAVTTAKLAAGAVDTSALGSLAVTSAKLNDAAVTAAKLASSAVETAKINDGAVTTAKIAADAVDASKLDLTDTYDFSSGTLQVGTPSNSNDVTNKSYVDSVAAGLSVKENVRVATNSNVDISSLPATIDGITMSNGDRCLLFGQDDDTENGVYSYTSSGSSMSRATDMDAGDDYPGAFLFAQEGNTFEDQGFVCINDTAPSLGVDSIAFQRFTGLGQVTVSGGLEKNGDQISIADGGVSSAKIADGAVTSAKIADSAVSSAKIADNSISNAKMADDSVGANEIIDGSVGSVALASGAVVEAKIADDAISTAKIVDTAITAAKLASSSVSTVKIADGAVTNQKLATDSVDTNELVDGSVSSAKIASSAVSSDKLAASAVTSAKIAAGAVGTTALASSSVTAVKLGITFAQEGAQISGSSTTTIDLAQTLPSNSINSVLVFKNGLNLRNMTALGDTPSDEDEYSVSANGGSGGVARLTFGSALADQDGLIIWYWY